MIEFVVLLMAIVAVGIVAYPIIKRGHVKPLGPGRDRLEELYSERNTAYSMIKELEFDRSTGILTNDDYQELESKYKSKAVSILKAIDGQSSHEDDSAVAIEKEVLEFRRSQAKTADAAIDIEKQVMALRQGAGLFCHECGVRCHDGDKFCSRCGATLHRGDNE